MHAPKLKHKKTNKKKESHLFFCSTKANELPESEKSDISLLVCNSNRRLGVQQFELLEVVRETRLDMNEDRQIPFLLR